MRKINKKLNKNVPKQITKGVTEKKLEIFDKKVEKL